MEQIERKKIGVLIPQSNKFPLMGKAFLNGLKLAIGNLDCEYHVESIGLGADSKQILNSYQKLSFQNSVDLTTGLLGHHGYNELANFVSQNEEILVTADLGAKKPVQNPEGVFQNSLGLYDSLGALVNYFEEESIQQIASSTCYYEAGYDFIESLTSALELTDKVEFCGHFITPLHPRENEGEIMLETMNAIQPDAIIAFHNDIYAKEHAEFLSQNDVHNNYPIYALPFSCSDELAKEFPAVIEKIKIVSSWFHEMENDENQKFTSSYQNKFNKTPDFFALLGYENGLIIRSAFEQTETPLKKAVENTNIEGPRGSINFSKDLNRTRYTNYLWEITNTPNNYLDKKILNKLDEARNVTQNNPITLEQNGWFNAYLCH